MTERKTKLPLFLLIFVVFSGIYLLNHFTLYTSDDYTYHFFYQGEYPTEQLREINSLTDIISSQISHWYKWNGRFVAHTIVQIFMQFDKIVFNLVNTLTFLALGIIIAHFAKKLSRIPHLKSWNLILSYFFLWWFLPEFGKTVLWVSGSVNYLWSSLFYLLWFYLILFEKTNKFVSIFFPIIGFLAGATNENTAPAIILSSGLYLTYRLFSKKEFYLSKWLSLPCALAGFYLILASPGSHDRASENALSLSTMIDSFLEILKYQRSFFLILYFLIAILITFLFKEKKLDQEQTIRLSSILLAHFTSTIILILSPEIPQRVFFGPTVLITIVCLSLLYQTLSDFSQQKVFQLGLVSLVITTGLAYGFVLYDNHKSYREVTHQYQLITEAKIKGQSTVELPLLSTPRTLYNAYHTTANLGEGSEYWFNQWMAAYFGMDKIIGIPPENENSHQE